MRKFLIFALVALMAMSLAGCWNVYLLEPPSPSAAETTLQSNRPIESVEPTPTPEAVAYPGGVATTMSWVQETSDGSKMSADVRVWEPVKLDREFMHPANSSHIIREYDVGDIGLKGGEVWVFAFSVTVENLGSGSVLYLVYMGVGDISKGQDFTQIIEDDVYDPGHIASEEYYFKTEISTHGGWQTCGRFPIFSDTRIRGFGRPLIPGQGRESIEGYVLFLDEKPYGATREDLEYGRDGPPAFVVSRIRMESVEERPIPPEAMEMQPIVSFSKDVDGNFVFGKEYSPVTDKGPFYWLIDPAGLEGPYADY